MDRRRLLADGLSLAGAALLTGCAGGGKVQRRGTPITILLNPMHMGYLPVLHAFERGYFSAAGLDVRIKRYTGSANAQLPILARGDVEIGGVIPAPALYNQAAAGFGIKLICALTQPRTGYLDGASLLVRKDIWDRRPFRSLRDLRGRSIDGAAQGNPIDMLVRSALLEAGLSTDDVDLGYKIRSPSDVPYLFREKQVDVAGVSEPIATFIAQRGLAHKWVGYSQVVPWYQDMFLAASEDFVRYRHDEARAFVKAHLRAVAEIDAGGGRWTADLLALSSKWTKLKAEDLSATGRLPYWSMSGAVDMAALARIQQFWFERRLVRDRADVSRLVGGIA